jgi:GNAT superfamily N-acetyltransferase
MLLLDFLNLTLATQPFVRSLYECSFPPYERRHWEQLLSMLSLPNMQVTIAKQENEPIGFAVYWKINSWYFLEHLAIHPVHESKGFGTAFMQWLLQQSGNHLLLETELPTDEKGRRRIYFYEKLGMRIAPFSYQQPPYRRGETTPAMHIMSAPAIVDENIFRHLTTTIRQQVFEAFY